MTGLDMAFAELGAEPLQQPDLLVRQLDPALGRGFLQSEQTLLPGQQLVAGPHAAHPARGDMDALERQFLGDAQRAMGGML